MQRTPRVHSYFDTWSCRAPHKLAGQIQRVHFSLVFVFCSCLVFNSFQNSIVSFCEVGSDFLDPYHTSKPLIGTSLAVQWLRLCASNAGGMGLIPGQGIKILHATQPKD